MILSSRSYIPDVFAGLLLVSPYVALPYLSIRRAETLITPANVVPSDSSASQLVNDILLSLVLTSFTLAFLGAYGKYQRRKTLSSSVKSSLGVAGDTNKAATIRLDCSTGFRIAQRVFGIALPFTAALQLGSLSVSVLLLVMISSGVLPMEINQSDLGFLQGCKRLLSRNTWALAFSSLLCFAATQHSSRSRLSTVTGILAVVGFTFCCKLPYFAAAAADAEPSYVSPPPSAKSTSAVPSTPWDVAESSQSLPTRKMSSPLIASTDATSLTLIAGALSAATAVLLYQFCGLSLMTTGSTSTLLLVSLLTMWSLLGVEMSVFRELPTPLATGLAAAIIGNAVVISSFQTFWQDAILAAMAYTAVYLDVSKSQVSNPAYVRPSPDEKQQRLANRKISAPTRILLQSTERYTLLHGILADRDSRRIFYFMLLNLSFMLVQSTYGVLTGSLGLISDSIHMFFDCFALLVGLCAAVMSKWPPSAKYPYGYGKLDTLAGFGNGIFLMLISIEIVWEAIERLVEGSDVSRTVELLIVSSLGLVVNLIGIMAFEHGHAHGHGGHSHSHTSHAHAHSPYATSPAFSITKPEQSHHQHGGDNMYGIYLHIMADALGSVAVVVSTICVRYFGWSGFDPLASCAIAVLIFASAVPLVFSSGKKLLLSLPGDVEYTLRDILAGISTIRGVVGYTVPKFWLDDIGKKDSEHEHHDQHHHDHHNHEHSHGHHHPHEEHSDSQEHSLFHQTNDDSHHGECENKNQSILGVIHVIASQHADLDDVRARVLDYLQSRNMDIIVQVERHGDVKCWCGGSQK
jgi:solute carrier family 30 (zinc transporter), member 5/7